MQANTSLGQVFATLAAFSPSHLHRLAVFWTMARILSNADVLLKVQAEISHALASSGGNFSLEMLQQLPYLGHCIKVFFCSLIVCCCLSYLLFAFM